MFLLVTIFPRTYLGNIQNENDEKNLDLKNRKTFFEKKEVLS